MEILSKMGKGWNLAMKSFGFLYNYPSLIVFPVLSTISFVLLILSFVIGIREPWMSEHIPQNDTYKFILLYAYYFFNSFIIIFFNMGLTYCIFKIFKGEDAGVLDGIGFSCSRIGSIVLWAAISATVGLILKMLRGRKNILGNILSGVAGTSWALATFFVLPVMAAENKGGMSALDRSASLFKETWGERAGAAFSFGFVGLVIFIVFYFLFQVVVFPFGIMALTIALFLMGSLITCLISTAETIFMIDVYQSAVSKSKSVDELQGIFI